MVFFITQFLTFKLLQKSIPNDGDHQTWREPRRQPRPLGQKWPPPTRRRSSSRKRKRPPLPSEPLPGVNITNILCAAFLYESLAQSFLYWYFKFELFWRKNIIHKMLVKLTKGCLQLPFILVFKVGRFVNELRKNGPN